MVFDWNHDIIHCLLLGGSPAPLGHIRGMFWIVAMSDHCYKHLMTERPQFKVRGVTSNISIVSLNVCEKLDFLIHSFHFQVISSRTETRI